ncbi:MAG: hypothetical protein J6T18_05800 [Bacteroidaceae bacterium]|nr:hypothetical protein [Bacteroidaceae bacterium]
MRRLFLLPILSMLSCALNAQFNMEPFRHLSVNLEAGLHGTGVEVAVPVTHHLVLKGGYNMAPPFDLFKTDILVNTSDLMDAQNRYEQISSATGEDQIFTNRFSGESVVHAGVRLGENNYRLMLNWYPFAGGKFYLSGGVCYSRSRSRSDLLRLEGHTSAVDWEALTELREKTGVDYEMKIYIGDKPYSLLDDGTGCGYLNSSLRIDPLKYYAGMGVGRCIPNRFAGFQIEFGAMFLQNPELYCQNRPAGSLSEAGDGSLGEDVKDISVNMEKYPIYPQMTLRLCFRVL